MKNVAKIAAIVLAVLVALSLIFGFFANSLSPFSPVLGEVRVVAQQRVCWSGSIGDSTKQGCGSAVYQVEGDLGFIVAVVQKQDAEMLPLTVEIWIDNEMRDTATTTASYGLVTVQG